MTRIGLIVLVFLLAVPALAQQPSYAPPDAELWRQMKEAFGAISMSLPAHQQVQQILQSVERQAQMNAARAEAERKAKEPAKSEPAKE